MYQLVYVYWYILDRGFPAGSMVKNPPAKTGDTGDSSFDPWVGKIPWRRKWHSRILAWRIPWTEEPGRLQSMGSQRVGCGWTNNTSDNHVLLGLFLNCIPHTPKNNLNAQTWSVYSESLDAKTFLGPLCWAVVNRSVVSSSLWPHGL